MSPSPTVSSVRRAIVNAPTPIAPIASSTPWLAESDPLPTSGATAFAALDAPAEKALQHATVRTTTAPRTSRRVAASSKAGRGSRPERSTWIKPPSKRVKLIRASRRGLEIPADEHADPEGRKRGDDPRRDDDHIGRLGRYGLISAVISPSRRGPLSAAQRAPTGKTIALEPVSCLRPRGRALRASFRRGRRLPVGERSPAGSRRS